MKTTDFAHCLSLYLTKHLPGEAGLSEDTIKSYRDTFKLFLDFAEKNQGMIPEKIKLSDFNADFVIVFLNWIEKERGCGISTRNLRLSALRAFAKYARYGRRDAVLLSPMYDSGARVQEMCNLKAGDVRLIKPYAVTLTGKGRKTRVVPIMESTATALVKHLSENRLDTPEKKEYPLFVNHRRTKLTRAGIAYILKKYSNAARSSDPLIPGKVSPHVFRHSKAMHMLQAGITLIYIRDFLGHENVETTEVYAKADTEMKRKAIEEAQIRIDPNLPDWAQDKTLMSMLVDLCN